MQEDMSANSLHSDLLLEIFRHLGSTAIIRCAGVCRTWRHTIIDNAWCLRPRPDHCLPDLLLGFFDWYRRITPVKQLEDMAAAAPGPSAETTDNNVLALENTMDVGPYDVLLTSRDGFVLIKVWHKPLTTSLCLCNVLAGTCRSIPVAEVGKSFGGCSYVLFTAYDDDSLPPDGVRILAAKGKGNHVFYQTFFSSTSGSGGDCWCPVKRSARLVEECDATVGIHNDPKNMVVLDGGFIVYWLVILLLFNGDDDEECDIRTCLFAMDTRTDRTWTTQLPKELSDSSEELAIATSDDCQRVYLIVSESHELRHQIEVWVLDGDGSSDDDSRWTLQWTMDVLSWLHPYWPWQSPGRRIWLRCICPRSGFLLAVAWGSNGKKQFLVGVDGSPARLLGSVQDNESSFNLEYEMDWSTYISKMKYF